MRRNSNESLNSSKKQKNSPLTPPLKSHGSQKKKNFSLSQKNYEVVEIDCDDEEQDDGKYKDSSEDGNNLIGVIVNRKQLEKEDQYDNLDRNEIKLFHSKSPEKLNNFETERQVLKIQRLDSSNTDYILQVDEQDQTSDSRKRRGRPRGIEKYEKKEPRLENSEDDDLSSSPFNSNNKGSSSSEGFHIILPKTSNKDKSFNSSSQEQLNLPEIQIVHVNDNNKNVNTKDQNFTVKPKNFSREKENVHQVIDLCETFPEEKLTEKERQSREKERKQLEEQLGTRLKRKIKLSSHPSSSSSFIESKEKKDSKSEKEKSESNNEKDDEINRKDSDEQFRMTRSKSERLSPEVEKKIPKLRERKTLDIETEVGEPGNFFFLNQIFVYWIYIGFIGFNNYILLFFFFFQFFLN